MHEILLPFGDEIHELLTEVKNSQSTELVTRLKELVERMDVLPTSAIQLARECGKVNRLITVILETLEDRKKKRISKRVKKVRAQIRSSITREQQRTKKWEYITWKPSHTSKEDTTERSIDILREFILAYLDRSHFPEKESDEWQEDREELLSIISENGQSRMAEMGVSNAWAHNGSFSTYLEALSASIGDTYDLCEEIDKKMRELKYSWEAETSEEKHEIAKKNLLMGLKEENLVSTIPLPDKATPEWEQDRKSILSFFSGDVGVIINNLGLAGCYCSKNSAFSSPLDALAKTIGDHYNLTDIFMERKRILKYEWVRENENDSKAQFILNIRLGLLENGLISSHPFPFKDSAAWKRDREMLMQMLINVTEYAKNRHITHFGKHTAYRTFLDALQPSIGEHYDLIDVIERKKRPNLRKIYEGNVCAGVRTEEVPIEGAIQ